MIFVDSNIPMYLVGAEHPNKGLAVEAVTDAVMSGEALVTSAEVYQEILHRYGAISRLDAVTPAYAVLDSITDRVSPVTEADVRSAKELLLAGTTATARDAVHTAVMQRLGCERILSFDGGFDEVPGITRLPLV